MTENRFKEQFMAIPVENHDTAAWANIERMKELSNVSIPSDNNVSEAKDYVDENQK